MKYSRTGAILAGVYLIATLLILLKAWTTGGEEAAWIAVIPVLPWILAFPAIDYMLNDGPLLYPVLIMGFAAVLYLIGWGLETWDRRPKKTLAEKYTQTEKKGVNKGGS
jgi:hypothetical protein